MKRKWEETREYELMERTSKALRQIDKIANRLDSVVHRLFAVYQDRLAEEIDVGEELRSIANTIQGNLSEETNLRIQGQDRMMGETLKALLGKAEQSA